MRRGGRPAAPRALAVPTGPLGSAGPPQTAETIFSCILERLTENWLGSTISARARGCGRWAVGELNRWVVRQALLLGSSE